MSVLVAYASKHGATRQIAERIAGMLRAGGLEAEARPVEAVDDPAAHDALVIGSAVYFGSWLKEAAAFVRRNRAVLASRPVWPFSSGPLGRAGTHAQVGDPRDAAVPKEIAAFAGAIGPRDHRVFFGALDHTRFGLCERLLWALPAGRDLLIEGDFRDWADVDSWAEGIARALAPAPTAGAPSRGDGA